MAECDFNCDACKRTLCTQGNPTLCPDEEELQAIAEELEGQIRGASKLDQITQPGRAENKA